MQESVANKQMAQECLKLGFIDKGTGKHQSNEVYSTQGLCPTEYATMWKEPFKILEVKNDNGKD